MSMMVSIKLQLMALSIVFILFTSHQAWGEQDCYEDKKNIMRVCINTIEIHGDYIPPSYFCRHLVGTSDMACICRKLERSDEVDISAVKLVHLARDCGQALSVGSKCGSLTVPPQGYIHENLGRQGAAVNSVGTAAEMSMKQRRQVQSLLKRLNKPPLTSIESPDGDIIDCVHISKQPAFDHPFLKNHTIQMWPSYHPEGLYADSNITQHPVTQTWHQHGKCPANTIPIRRTKEEDVLKASSVKRYGKKRPRSIPNFFSVDDLNKPNVTIGHQHAIAYARKDKYYGTKVAINLWQPTIARAKDFSLAQLWIAGGSYRGKDLNTIEAGWQVFPEMYGNRYTRLFIYWTRDAYQRTGCYNLQCSGFIQINNKIAIGASFSPVSIYGGSQYELNILIWKDPKKGNWWLQVGSTVLGYWPPSIFSYLANSASEISWGGEVYSPYAGQTSTVMGSGHFAGEGFGKASYIKNIQVVDSSNKLTSPSTVGLVNEQPNCYNVQRGTNSINWGTSIFYGGPGKNRNCP